MMNYLQIHLNLSRENVHIFGRVDSLEGFYRHAEFVIVPIFSGSGMKTKIAEALKHGKFIVGSKQAFIGYEDLEPELGVIANGKKEYLFFGQNFLAGRITVNENLAKETFLKRYSEHSAKNKVREILSEL